MPCVGACDERMSSTAFERVESFLLAMDRNDSFLSEVSFRETRESLRDAVLRVDCLRLAPARPPGPEPPCI